MDAEGTRELEVGRSCPCCLAGLTLAVLPAGQEAVAGGAKAPVAAFRVLAGMLAQVGHQALIQVCPEGWEGDRGRCLLSQGFPGHPMPAGQASGLSPNSGVRVQVRGFLLCQELERWLGLSAEVFPTSRLSLQLGALELSRTP